MTTMQSEWESFRQEVVHPSAPREQLTEMRVAFMAGATAMLSALEYELRPDTAAVAPFWKELLAFKEKVLRGGHNY